MGKTSVKWVAIFSIATNLLMIVPPMHMLQVYDRVLSSNSVETLIYITLIAGAALILFGVAEAVRGYLAQRASARYTVEVADPLFEKLTGTSDGSAPAALRDFNTVRSFISSKAMIALFDLPFTPLFLLLMFMLHWSLGLFTLVGFIALGGIAILNKKMTAEKSKSSQQADAQALNFAQTIFSRTEDVRAMGLLPAVMDRWGDKIASSLVSADAASGQSNAFQGLSKSVRKILQISIMAWGAYLVILGEMSGGVIFAATMISGRALAPFEQFIGSWDRISQARRANENINKLLEDTGSQEEIVALPDPKGAISVEGLMYSPSTLANARPVLDDITFGIGAGKTLAIIGPSGAGKSTLAKAIVGAVTPESGFVRLDGAERSQWSEAQWGQAVGYVSQEVVMFPGTLSENIARLDMRADDAKVVAAAQAAGIHEMIIGLPDGYSTELGPGKVLLSGGQKQRLALARALYSDPKVLVLDEPNAHLDKQGEQLLMNALVVAKKAGRTVIIVTQRRNVLDLADAVMTVRNGKIDSYITADEAKKRSEKQTEPVQKVSSEKTGQPTTRQKIEPPALDMNSQPKSPVAGTDQLEETSREAV